MGYLYFLQMTLIFFVSDKSWKWVFNETRAILDKVNNYMKWNLLHINILKCCFMYFSPNKREMRNEGADEDDTILKGEYRVVDFCLG